KEKKNRAGEVEASRGKVPAPPGWPRENASPPTALSVLNKHPCGRDVTLISVRSGNRPAGPCPSSASHGHRPPLDQLPAGGGRRSSRERIAGGHHRAVIRCSSDRDLLVAHAFS